MPVVLKGGAKDWLASRLWSPDYFAQLLSEKEIEIVLFEMKNGIRERSLLPAKMGQAISWMRENRNPNKKYYILKDAVCKNYSELAHDFPLPQWAPIDSCCTNLWFGEGGNLTSLHFDTTENFLVQIYGRKKVRLFSPINTPHLYPHGLKTGGRFNFSRITDLDADLKTLYPLFDGARYLEETLDPGDILYLPPGWWHEVRTIDLGISLNFWFSPRKDKGPLWHLLGHVACCLDNGALSEEACRALYLCTFANALETAKRMCDWGYLWVSVLICGTLLEAQLQSAYDCLFLLLPDLVPLIDPEKLEEIADFLCLINLTVSEDSSIFTQKQVMGFIHYLYRT